MDGERIVCLISTIAQAPVLIVPLLHETGALYFEKYVFTTIDLKNNFLIKYHCVHYLIALAFFNSLPPGSKGSLNWLCFPPARRLIYCHILLQHKTLRRFTHWQIGFVFSTSCTQYPARSPKGLPRRTRNDQIGFVFSSSLSSPLQRTMNHGIGFDWLCFSLFKTIKFFIITFPIRLYIILYIL